MKNIINLTQHNATQDQLNAGVFEPNAVDKAEIVSLLTFDDIPTNSEMMDKASRIVEIVCQYDNAEMGMLGGAPFFMSYLEAALAIDAGIKPIYAFSKRLSEEYMDESGNVHKKNVFKHLGFVGMPETELKSTACDYCGDPWCNNVEGRCGY